MAVLDVDLGNSRIKYRSLDQPEECFGALDYDSPLPPLAAVERVRVSSVLSGEREARFRRRVRERYGCECEFARSVSAAAGVTNGYQDPSALGVDRWLAVLAAHRRFESGVLVVDLGTAATFDFVTAQGAHLGGYIVPGLALMRRSLLTDTAEVRYGETRAPSDLQPGTTTRDAVERGLLAALVSLVQAELEHAQQLCQHSARLVLCGGDADAVAAHLEAPHEIVPDLVLDGLALALP